MLKVFRMQMSFNFPEDDNNTGVAAAYGSKSGK
jgi:hypothetical protein